MSQEDEEPYTNVHRAFLQAFLARSTLTFDEAKPILAAVLTAHEGRETLPNDITESDFTTYISTINTSISPFDFEIRSSLSQTTRERIYAIVNTTSDPITQLATTHTADEIAYLKRVLDAIFETYNTDRHEVMAITSMQALRLHKGASGARDSGVGGDTQSTSTSAGLTMAQAERMLKSLVDEGWFELSRKGYYSLSPRAFMELRGWLLDTYNEPMDEDEEAGRVERIKLCRGCKEIVSVVSSIARGRERDREGEMVLTTAGSTVSKSRVSMPPALSLHKEYLPS
ncbi:hypothetical protein LTR66_000112 [Elasticomyces elasticus]|nr:hypothetical protein LTR66_000112 [Elasticomyces elasticus]